MGTKTRRGKKPTKYEIEVKKQKGEINDWDELNIELNLSVQ